MKGERANERILRNGQFDRHPRAWRVLRTGRTDIYPMACIVPRTDDEGRPKSTTGTSDQTRDGPATKLVHRPKDKIKIRPGSKDECFGPWGMTG